jgi:hypothetical protein
LELFLSTPYILCTPKSLPSKNSCCVDRQQQQLFSRNSFFGSTPLFSEVPLFFRKYPSFFGSTPLFSEASLFSEALSFFGSPLIGEADLFWEESHFYWKPSFSEAFSLKPSIFRKPSLIGEADLFREESRFDWKPSFFGSPLFWKPSFLEALLFEALFFWKPFSVQLLRISLCRNLTACGCPIRAQQRQPFEQF